jgi:hypothetical protein
MTRKSVVSGLLPGSAVSARTAGRVVLSGYIASPVRLPVGRSPRPAGCMPHRIARSLRQSPRCLPQFFNQTD